ncbi:MAG: VWA domain-containing protein [Paludibacteraceae bacterium]|nr:VWA domain-containing protein [Paludibacteraceae bacterium]MBP3574981.1 VWA domain-containing protein [Paludibacteraceae bacterium]
MFRFANIEMLWWLIAVPVFVIGYVVSTKRKQRQLQEFGDKELMAQLMPDASKSRPIWKFCLLIVAFVLLIVAAARPQYGQKENTVKRQGIEVMVALDISNSMLAEDVAPNRLDRAKQMLSKMIDHMVDDKVGLVVFAGEAFTQLPITCDYVSAKMFLNTITPNLIQTQGTAIGTALQTAISSFGSLESEAGRAIVLITDGENHEDDAIAAAKQAHELGMQVFVIGIGKPEGAPIPKPGTNDYFKDRSGQVVVSKLNEEMCQQIAEAGSGVYVRCDNTNTAMRALQQELDRIATTELETTVYADYNEQYQSFALIALLLLMIEFFIMSRQNHRLTRMDLFKENPHT